MRARVRLVHPMYDDYPAGDRVGEPVVVRAKPLPVPVPAGLKIINVEAL
jgi:hypothetical protein